MPSPVEREIASLMRETRDVASVVSALRDRWRLGETSAEDLKAIAAFFLRAGFARTLIEACRASALGLKPIPWASLAEALAAAGVEPTPEETRAIGVGADEQGATSDLLASRRPDSWSPLFQIKRGELANLRALELEDRRAQLWDAVRFMRANRLIEQEAQALEELRSVFPDDPEFAGQNRSLQERWARDVLSKGPSARELEQAEERDEVLSPEERAARDEIAKQALESARARPDRAVDFALFLHFMGFHQEAADALGPAGPSADRRRDWLRLELLLLARRFVTVLETATRLESQLKADPEAAFACAYAKARALWGLGERERAQEAMRAIVAVRPAYRSATSLLSDWSGGRNG